jgi:peptide/nickel transport system substrate-binding protein
MDYSQYDKVRRSTTPLQLDMVEAYAQGRLSRREFMRRGIVVGLSMASISAIIAACDTGTKSSTAASGAPGGSAAASGAVSSGPATAGGAIKVAVQRPVKFDPINMQDLAAYGLVAQSFEFLAALDPQTKDIGPGLAEKWTPNGDNSVWTFNLRKNVKWQDGKDFTADDVVATMGRLVAAGNAGLKGVIDDKSTKAVDPNTVEFTLVSANGNFPYLVSVFNAQSVITPKDYATGTTADAKPNGTGAFKLDSFDMATGAKFSRNDTWWGGKTPLDSVEFLFFDDVGPMVTAYQGNQLDAIVQFDVNTGASLFNDPNFTVNEAKTTNHRQIWMRCDKGQFTDKKVRQALALSLDREAMVQQLFKGKAEVANDHVIFDLYPYFDPSVPQRVRDVAKAKQLLTAAGKDGLTATLNYGQLQEIPDLAVLIQSNAKDAGMTITPAGEDNGKFYGDFWCPDVPKDPPCSGASELGIVDYGHRSTPDLFLNSALKTKGIWNSSQYSSPDFDAAFSEFQKAVGVDAQKAACKKIETILNEDVPVSIPYIYSFLSGNSKKFTGVYSSALGQMFFSSASQA